MTTFIIRRVAWTIPVILLVILMTFLLMKQIKGNPFRHTEKNVPASIQRNLEHKFHLDKPWYTQYAYYVKGVFTFDLGPSMSQRTRTVNDVVKDGFPRSLKLGILAYLWAILFGVPAGILAALKPNSIFDYGAMLETMQQDYVRTAKAKGLRYRRVIGLHVLRNSLIPAVTATAPLLGLIITGTFVIEFIFSIPGIGRYFINSVSNRDYSVVLGITVLTSIIIVIANLFVDIMYGVLDPRTREAR